jgi:pantetheine-phosphate adenylyltransferase
MNDGVAIYPGTFDPLTRGHEDLVRRASRLFDEVVVAVADSRSKRPFFTLEERVDMARELLSAYPNVRVEGFDWLADGFPAPPGCAHHPAGPARGVGLRV